MQPDLVSQNKDDEVLAKIRAAGFDVVAQKKFTPPRDIVEQFYAEHKGREFFPVSGAARGEPTQR
jgi:nucleoside diphosphate kinase